MVQVQNEIPVYWNNIIHSPFDTGPHIVLWNETLININEEAPIYTVIKVTENVPSNLLRNLFLDIRWKFVMLVMVGYQIVWDKCSLWLFCSANLRYLRPSSAPLWVFYCPKILQTSIFLPEKARESRSLRTMHLPFSPIWWRNSNRPEKDVSKTLLFTKFHSIFHVSRGHQNNSKQK